jgi:hypothetical protein
MAGCGAVVVCWLQPPTTDAPSPEAVAMRERRPTDYRATRDFQIASKDIFAVLQTDLNGRNVRRAQAARQLFEFLSLLLAHSQRMEDRAAGKFAELQRLRGQVDLLSKKVVVVSHTAIQDGGSL